MLVVCPTDDFKLVFLLTFMLASKTCTEILKRKINWVRNVPVWIAHLSSLELLTYKLQAWHNKALS